MGTKSNPGKCDFYAMALSDEPMFILLARDPDFHRLVTKWAHRRIADVQCGLWPQDVVEAQAVAFEGREWRRRNNGIWRTE
jgi:ribonuclease I